jgi:ferritin-like metal-binding protein YciE
MPIGTLQDLYLHELKDIYNAEKQLLQALPKMAKTTKHNELRQALEQHRQVTEEQVRRLETIFDDLGQTPSGRKCRGMEGIIEEGEELLQEEADPDVRDAALIASAQRVEHYEIATYGTLRTYAHQLGFDNHVDLLQRTLDEEGETDRLLTQLAESRVNKDAEFGRRR